MDTIKLSSGLAERLVELVMAQSCIIGLSPKRMEADWDPVAKKVIYRKKEDPKQSNRCKDREQQPSWRDDDLVKDKPGDDSRSSPSERRRPRSHGVKPSHPISKKVEDFHNNTTMSVIQRKTQTARASHDRLRQAYQEVSVISAFPLQEMAVRFLQELRIEWGIEPDEEIVDPPNQDATSCAVSNASSCNSQPQSKRHLSNHNEESIQQLKEKFLQQRQPSPPSHVFANPLYSLEPRIWSTEAATTGKRRYVVAHAGRFFDHYWRKTIPADRHAYELIRPNAPCRLYLDIECTRDDFLIASSQLQDELLYELWMVLAKEIEERFRDFSVGGNHLESLNQQDHLIDLESNSSTKFSRHWIFHLKTSGGEEVLFPNNAAVGRFVKGFVSRLADDPSWREDYPVLSKYLFLSTHCLLDLGVYSRNRIFRLLGSCKYGKSATLHVARSNQFDLGITNDCASLRSDPSLEGTSIDEQVQETIRRTADWSDHARALAETLVVPLNSSKFQCPLLPVALEESVELPKLQQPAPRSTTSHFRGQSKYPAIEQYILDRFGDRGGTVGRVRVWSIFENRHLSFHMMDNRWCERIGRQHKSNNIVWNVDLDNRTCHQTCHDPDCRGFRGETFALPNELFDTDRLVDQNLDDEEFFGDDEFERALAALNIDDAVATLRNQEGTNSTEVKKAERPSPTHVAENSSVIVSRESQFASWLDSDDSSVDEVKTTSRRKPNGKPCLREESKCNERCLSKTFVADDETVLSADRSNCEVHLSKEIINGIDGNLPKDVKPEISVSTQRVVSLHEQGFASWLDSPESVALNDQNQEGKGAAWFSSCEITETNIDERIVPRVDCEDCLLSPNTQSHERPVGESTLKDETDTRRSETDSNKEDSARPFIATKVSIASASTEGEKGFAGWLESPDNEPKENPLCGPADKFASWLDSDSSSDE